MKHHALLLLSAIFLTGCAGAHCYVTAHSVAQPVSCTSCVFDSSGRIRPVKTQEIVRHVVLTKFNWSVLWKSVPLNSKNWDISDELNARLRQTPGNAIVNVTVTAQGCNLIHWYLAGLIPIIPSYVNVTVEGDIARVAD